MTLLWTILATLAGCVLFVLLAVTHTFSHRIVVFAVGVLADGGIRKKRALLSLSGTGLCQRGHSLRVYCGRLRNTHTLIRVTL